MLRSSLSASSALGIVIDLRGSRLLCKTARQNSEVRPTHYRSCRQSELEGLRPFVEHQRHLDSRKNPLATSKIRQAYQRGTPAHIYTDQEIVALLSGGRPSRNTRRRADAATPSARYAASGPIQLSSSSPSGKRLPSGRFVGYSSI